MTGGDGDDEPERLLPGDPAPDLKLSVAINRKALPTVRFDRLSLVVLWNAGCGTCMPALERLSELGAAHDVACYGIGVMVHHLEATKERMAGRAPNAILAIEEPPPNPNGLSRGWVTRHWLEASGQEGVPAAFVVDETGTVVWMGHPDGLEAVFPELLKGGWDVEAARRQWRASVPDEAVGHLHAVRTLTDASIAGDDEAVIALIERAERKWPGIVRHKGYCRAKLAALAYNRDHRDAAVAHYAHCVEAFGRDRDYQIGLAAWILEKRLPEAALHPLVACLAGHARASRTVEADDRREAMMQQWLNILLADALIRLGRHDEARPRIARADALLQSPVLDDDVRRDGRTRLIRLKAAMPIE